MRFALLLLFSLSASAVELSSGYFDGKLVMFTTQDLPGVDLQGFKHKLIKEAADSYMDMFAAAMREGVLLKLNYSYRDYNVQKALYRKMPRVAAAPGTSSHEIGLAIDLSNTPGAHKWMAARGEDFGWWRPYPNEPWHFEFVGNLPELAYMRVGG
jgi:LAS superfamily LD-carboxypeptidase LdcB